MKTTSSWPNLLRRFAFSGALLSIFALGLAAHRAVARIESGTRQFGAQVDTWTTPWGHPPSRPARYYVALGRPASHAHEVSNADLDRGLQLLRERLATIEGVVIAPMNE